MMMKKVSFNVGASEEKREAGLTILLEEVPHILPPIARRAANGVDPPQQCPRLLGDRLEEHVPLLAHRILERQPPLRLLALGHSFRWRQRQGKAPRIAVDKVDRVPLGDGVGALLALLGELPSSLRIGPDDDLALTRQLALLVDGRAPQLHVHLALQSPLGENLDASDALLEGNGGDDGQGLRMRRLDTGRAPEGIVGSLDDGEELGVASAEGEKAFLEDGRRGRGGTGNVDAGGEVRGLELKE